MISFRCENCKRALGSVGTYEYTNLIVEQFYCRLKICDLHFPENLKTHLKYKAVPSSVAKIVDS